LTESDRAIRSPHTERVAVWPIGYALSFPQGSTAERVFAGDDSIQVALGRKGRPALPDNHDEEIVARWVALNGLDRDPECEVLGTASQDGGSAHGRIAVGTTLMLLTDRYLRCAMRQHDCRVMLHPPKLASLTKGWTYAFVLDLVDVDFVNGGSKLLGFGSAIEALSVQSVVPADEDWDYKPKFKGCGEFAGQLMSTILTAKEIYGDSAQQSAAAAITRTDYRSKLASRWKPSKFDFA
jgi:hypothetical protein